MTLFSKYIITPLGRMRAIANENYLLALDFEGGKYFDKNFAVKGEILEKSNEILDLVEKELQLYFSRELQHFSTPILFNGTEFQKKVWKELLKIPFGETISYQEQAKNLGNPLSVRAVANANSRNKIAIIVPCHRVIGKNKKLTGYAGGIDKKQILLDLEKNITFDI